ncbi:hypothetical protein [Knoellia koreensis]|uniref:Uncharacterized protein n=1 Tax=Knoellia koreensis TaxID=2730921 RepID=A0A849HBI9_9MICO|nr:hypothetical protein [Knoellia sp. DB2414S]NNM44768.1 hypothetical protein [Knoellia sp. DB2414S]
MAGGITFTASQVRALGPNEVLFSSRDKNGEASVVISPKATFFSQICNE